MNCDDCPYRGSVTVPPKGMLSSPLWIIGEAPGENEEKQRQPFVGGAGRVLYRLLRDAGIDPQNVYYTNVLKCRPPANDITTSDAHKAIECCVEQLHTELVIGKPRLIVPVGNTAMHALGIEQTITKVRGTPFLTQWGKVIPTFHPAYLMRQQQEFITAAYDWSKIATHMKTTGVTQFREDYNVTPTVEDVYLLKQKIDKEVQEKGNCIIAVDLETPFPGDTYEKTILVCGISLDKDSAVVVPFHKADGKDYWRTKEEELEVIQLLSDIFNNPHVIKVLHNSMFDIAVLMSLGFPFVGPVYDTMLAHWLVYEPAHHSLAYCASIYTDFPQWKVETKWTDDLSLRKRNARDCCTLFPIMEALNADMRDNGLEWLFNVLMKNIIPTVRMEMNGIPIESSKRDEVDAELSGRVMLELADIRKLVGDDTFNPNSPKQVGVYLKDQFGTHGSTGKDVLENLAVKFPGNPFPTKLLHYRSMSKMYTTYVRDVRIWPDGRARSHFYLGTVTGRYKSDDPNFQNLPTKRKDPDGFVKRMYSGGKGKVIIEGDISQTELRIFAAITHDDKWLTAFDDPTRDVHKENCIALVGEYKKEWRTFIKNFIYGLIYGSDGSEIAKMMPLELMQRGITVDRLLAKLHLEHPGVKQYFQEVEESVRKDHKVVNPFGLTRWFPGEITKANIREAVNFPIQSSNAVLMQYKMPFLMDSLGPEDELILQLHDAFYVLTDERRCDKVASIMKTIMEEPLTAPNGMVFQLPVSIEYGTTMFDGDMKPWNKEEE